MAYVVILTTTMKDKLRVKYFEHTKTHSLIYIHTHLLTNMDEHIMKLQQLQVYVHILQNTLLYAIQKQQLQQTQEDPFKIKKSTIIKYEHFSTVA